MGTWSKLDGIDSGKKRKMKSSSGFWTFISLIIGIGLVTWGLSMLHEMEISFAENSSTVFAEITEIQTDMTEQNPYDKGRTVTIVFHVNNIRYELPLGYWDVFIKEGDVLQVTYNALDPTQIVYYPLWRHLIAYACIVVGAISVLWSFSSFYEMFLRPRPDRAYR